MAAPTKGNTTNANPTPGANFYQFSHNQNTGNNRLLVVLLSMNQIRSYTGATYNGVAMTQLYSIVRGGLSQRMALFYLIDPPTGSNTLRVNFSSTVWNPISVHARSFTDSGGIGNSLRTGGTATPHNSSLTVSQDSLIMTQSVSVNQILTQQIPTGTNRTFVTHNVNRQVATGAISADAGHSAGTINLRATATFGNLTLDRTEIKGLASSGGSGGDFFLVM
jgi:hypothetical protein